MTTNANDKISLLKTGRRSGRQEGARYPQAAGYQFSYIIYMSFFMQRL